MLGWNPNPWDLTVLASCFATKPEPAHRGLINLDTPVLGFVWIIGGVPCWVPLFLDVRSEESPIKIYSTNSIEKSSEPFQCQLKLWLFVRNRCIRFYIGLSLICIPPRSPVLIQAPPYLRFGPTPLAQCPFISAAAIPISNQLPLSRSGPSTRSNTRIMQPSYDRETGSLKRSSAPVVWNIPVVWSMGRRRMAPAQVWREMRPGKRTQWIVLKSWMLPRKVWLTLVWRMKVL